MNDLARITDLIAAKQRELVDFAVGVAGDVMSADMSEIDRGQLALGLLGLIAKSRQAPGPIVIDHVTTPPLKVIAAPKPEKADAVKDSKAAKEAKPKSEWKRYSDEMIAEALASTPTVKAAIKKLGCSLATMYGYRKRVGLIETPEALAARMAAMRARRGKGHARSEPKLLRPTHSDAEIAAAIAEGGTDKEAARILRCDTKIIRTFRARHGMARANNGGVTWNAANIGKLRGMATKSPRPPDSELAAAFGTSASAIQTAMSRFGITKKGLPRAGGAADLSHLTNRDCMACLQPFLSEGKHNRLCPKCKASDEDVAA